MSTPTRGQSRQARGAQAPDPLNERVQVGQVAALLAERRKRQSVRDLAREIKISKSSVDGLVKAYHDQRELPQPHLNWQKLKDWYLREKYAEAGGLSEPVDMAILALEMLAELPETERRAAVRELAGAMTEIYDRRRVAHPVWLQRLAEAARAEEVPEPSRPPT